MPVVAYVVWGGIEPPTQGFSVLCSTDSSPAFGKAINIHCNPNFSKNIRDRNRALQALSYNIRKKLKQGWSPEMIKATVKPPLTRTAGDRIKHLLIEFDTRDISRLYNCDLQRVGTEFLEFLKHKEILSSPITDITPVGNCLVQFVSKGWVTRQFL